MAARALGGFAQTQPLLRVQIALQHGKQVAFAREDGVAAALIQRGGSQGHRAGQLFAGQAVEPGAGAFGPLGGLQSPQRAAQFNDVAVEQHQHCRLDAAAHGGFGAGVAGLGTGQIGRRQGKQRQDGQKTGREPQTPGGRASTLSAGASGKR